MGPRSPRKPQSLGSSPVIARQTTTPRKTRPLSEKSSDADDEDQETGSEVGGKDEDSPYGDLLDSYVDAEETVKVDPSASRRLNRF